MLNLGFSKRKLMASAILLVCIIGSLIIDSMLHLFFKSSREKNNLCKSLMHKEIKRREGFQEGAKNKTSSNKKKLLDSINSVLIKTEDSEKSLAEIKSIISKYIKTNEINSIINNIVHILNIKTSENKKINDQTKVNMIALLVNPNK